MQHEIIIEEDGRVRFLYDDGLKVLGRMLGHPTITRASHVEPTADGNWTVDMSPLQPGFTDGPFFTRAHALLRERRYVGQYLRGEPMTKL